MSSLILCIATRFLLPLLLVFSIFLLLRGHNEVGGGFAGGLVAAVAVVLYLFGLSLASVRRLLPLPPIHLIGLGLLAAGGSGGLGLLRGEPFLQGLWFPHQFAFMGGFHLGTPFLFDVGVYLVAAGSLLLIIDSLEGC